MLLNGVERSVGAQSAAAAAVLLEGELVELSFDGFDGDGDDEVASLDELLRESVL